MRLALGARRGRLIRQSLTESLALALAGTALGLLLASVGARVLVVMVFRGARNVPIATTPNLHVLAFTLGISLLSAVVFGLLPALRGSQAELLPALKSSSGTLTRSARSQFGIARFGLGRLGLGNAAHVGQVALSLVLLAGAGLF